MTWRKRPCRLCGRKTHPEELIDGACTDCVEDQRVGVELAAVVRRAFIPIAKKPA